MLEPGVILGDFEIRRFLGRGGMGDVYEARQRSLGRSVALKTLPAAVSLDQHVLNRFQREASIAAQLDHPNIIPVYAFGVSGPNAYFAMKLVRGVTLSRFIQHCQPVAPIDQSLTASMPETADRPEDFDPDDVEIYLSPSPSELGPQLQILVEAFRRDPGAVAARIGRDLARALDYAHRLGHLHRDIKPHNVMLDDEGQVYLIDFGLTRTMVAHSTEHRSGTPRYMSPEQFDLEKLDGRTDVYSLGVTLYEVLSGRPAFRASETGGLGRLIRNGEVEPLATLCPGVPPDLARCIVRAMNADRQERYATAGEFADALAEFAAPPATPARRRSRLAITSLIGVMLCVAVLAGWASRTWTANPEPVVSPASRTARPEWEPAQKTDLLRTEPARLVGTESTWQHAAGTNALSVDSPRELTLLSLGEPPGPRFELEVDVEQAVALDPHHALAGVFWLWQAEARPNGFICESLGLERTETGADFRVTWRRPEVMNGFAGLVAGRMFPLGGHVPSPPHRLRLRVIDGQLDDAHWNGQSVIDLAGPSHLTRRPLRPAGPVGLIVFQAQTTVSRFHLTTLKRNE